jgi:hypothetical protein
MIEVIISRDQFSGNLDFGFRWDDNKTGKRVGVMTKINPSANPQALAAVLQRMAESILRECKTKETEK